VPEKWQTSILDGIQHLKLGLYGDAVASFQEAVDLQGNNPITHLYLALGLNQRYIPSGISPENALIASQIEAEFRRALELDPSNWPALVMLGKLTLDEGKFEESRSWYRKALDLDSSNADTWCALGAIAWQQWRAAVSRESERILAELGRAAWRNWHPPPGFRQDLVNQGGSNLQQALKLDPANRNAIGFLAAFAREGADLGSMAGPWDQRFLAAITQERPPDGSIRIWPPALAGTHQVVRDADNAWLERRAGMGLQACARERPMSACPFCQSRHAGAQSTEKSRSSPDFFRSGRGPSGCCDREGRTCPLGQSDRARFTGG
jgi:tetratricopeptide (TPR) repeat protein